ncbi:MAG: hypothetical protein Ct9H90mP11_01720 [Acidimicrobiales bacterium]|nr:MAG: hypothetical protein Ct9H90mP11_01720 [Acidimicrobiales bacterium]
MKEVQSFVIQGRADFPVHSLKDLPSDTPSELVLAAVPDRGDPRDALVGSNFKKNPLTRSESSNRINQKKISTS